jgi:hypothetical protein
MKFKRRFAYHYCASYIQDTGGIVYIDGVAWLKVKPIFMKDYRLIKNLLLEGLESSNLTIRTLSYVGREPFFNKKEVAERVEQPE